MTYLEMVMKQLANIVYNVSQNPNESKCNAAIDSLKSIITQYNEDSGKQVQITDFRKDAYHETRLS